MHTVLILTPIVIYLGAMLAMGFAIQRSSSDARAENFSKDYFIGGRSLGGFVLAMTLVATYSSVSSFVGGPGVAWDRGFGWVYYAMTQVVAAFLVMGVMGKKIAIVSRKIDAVTIIDLVRVRYQSNLLANLAAFAMVAFFCGTMVAQFMGGANLFAVAAGVDYKTGLFIFAVVVVIFTAIGGFKAVAYTDAVCAMAMLVGMAVIAYGIFAKTGMRSIMEVVNQNPHMLQPTAGGKIPVQLFITQWMLCGVCTLGLPQSLVRNMVYKDSKALHRAMIYGTVVVGAMMLGMHLLGVLSRGVILELAPGATTDTVTPRLISGHLPPLLAGIAIIGPLAATISTVDSLLIAAASAIIKDVYQHMMEARGKNVTNKTLGSYSIMATSVIGMLCVIAAIKPPTVIVWVNMFAFGGLQTAFFWTFLFGMFWSKANKTGATMGMIGGVIAYCAAMIHKPAFLGGFHQIIIGVVVALILFLIGNAKGKPNDEKVLKLFFPEKYPDGTVIEKPERI